MSKFDYSKVINTIKKSYEKDTRRANQFGDGNDLEKLSEDPSDYVLMDSWFSESFGAMGIPFGKMIEISGNPDAGKTTFSLEAIKKAQEQGHVVIYAETEGKTGPERLKASGVDPDQVISIRTSITEELFQSIDRTLDIITDQDPEARILLVIDSLGQTTSLRNEDLDLTEKAIQVGGEAKVNRAGLAKVAIRQIKFNIAVVIVNYSYANLGSVGTTNAGGKAIEFYCSLILEASRKADYKRTIQGQQVKAGIDAVWKVKKNHFWMSVKDENGDQIYYPDRIEVRITGEGIKKLK